mgnify:CR=1 FL=1|jgi:thiamine transport system substrate-binding protein
MQGSSSGPISLNVLTSKNTGELGPPCRAERVAVAIDFHGGATDPLEPELGNASGGREMKKNLFFITLLIFAITVTACGEEENRTITLLTHDSFWISDEVLQEFTDQTGTKVELQMAGDTGQLLASAILTASNPAADVIFGIDNTFLQRALDADIFSTYESPSLRHVPEEIQLDSKHRVTPIDFGDVCINYWIDSFDSDLPAPESLEDLIDPQYYGQLVVQNPETSSPGLAFLLATIAEYGEDWETWWAGLRDNGVTVTSGWEDAYEGEFVAGGGDHPLVVSYASSPPAEVIYSETPISSPPTGVLTDTCFRQIEFAGVVNGTKHQETSEALIDFMLSKKFQEDIPNSMLMFPASTDADLPKIFSDFAEVVENPYMLAPDYIEENRNDWTERWTEIVLR